MVRDLPLALAAAGHRVSVLTPAYGVFSEQPEAHPCGQVSMRFAGRNRRVRLSRKPGPDSNIEFLFLDHGIMNVPGKGVIYHDDGPFTPFATDATRFAFFSAAIAACVERAAEPPDVLHLQDWHTGLVPALRKFDPACDKLRSVRTVFTIHNLALQGIRPLRGHASALESWFPRLKYTRGKLGDPRYPDCVNPMATGIRLADRVNTVSPSYAAEILRPNDPLRGFSGGEGLEEDLRKAADEGRLLGILNGCAYPGPGGRRPGWKRLLEAIAAEEHLLAGNPPAQRLLQVLPGRRPRHLLTSIGRVSDQKTALFLEPVGRHGTALETILTHHAEDSVFIMLGSGSRSLENRLIGIAGRHANFLYLRGYSETLPDLLYKAGDLFLMPSSFEPCGISQMLAMRAGQPCVVHAVGGLRDTVEDGVTGFSFQGNSPQFQARGFVRAVGAALQLRRNDPAAWEAMRARAAALRFSWKATADAYISELYELGG